MDVSAVRGKRRDFLYLVRRAMTAIHLLSRGMRRKRRPRSPDWAMNDHLLRDIGLQRKDLEPNARRPGFSKGFYDDHRQY